MEGLTESFTWVVQIWQEISHRYFQHEEEAEKKQADQQSKVQEAMQEVGYAPNIEERQDTDEPDIGLMKELEEDDGMTDEERVSFMFWPK